MASGARYALEEDREDEESARTQGKERGRCSSQLGCSRGRWVAVVDIQTPDERLESVYELAMAHEFEAKGLAFVRQCKLPIRYKDRALGEMRVDLLVEGALIVELKSVDCVTSLHVAQTLAYLKASRLPLGLLINFNVPVPLRGVRRVVLTRPQSDAG